MKEFIKYEFYSHCFVESEALINPTNSELENFINKHNLLTTAVYYTGNNIYEIAYCPSNKMLHGLLNTYYKNNYNHEFVLYSNNFLTKRNNTLLYVIQFFGNYVDCINTSNINMFKQLSQKYSEKSLLRKNLLIIKKLLNSNIDTSVLDCLITNI